MKLDFQDFDLIQDYGKKERERRKKLRIIQRILGLVAIVTGLASIPLLDMDATLAVFMVPVGIALLVSREIWIDG